MPAMQTAEQAADHGAAAADVLAVFGFGFQAQPFYALGDALPLQVFPVGIADKGAVVAAVVCPLRFLSAGIGRGAQAEFVLLRFADCLRNVVADNKRALKCFGGASAGDALGAEGFNVVVAVKGVGVEHVGVAPAAVAGDGFFLRGKDTCGEWVGAVFELGRDALSSGVTGRGRSARCLSSP